MYGTGNCQFRAQLGNRLLQDWKQMPATGANWIYFGPYGVNEFNFGDGDAPPGSDGLSLKVRFSMRIQCLGSRSDYSYIRFDSFSVYGA